MTEGVAVETLGKLIEAEASFSPKGGGKGSQTFGVIVEVQCPGAGDGDNGSGGGFPCALVVSSEPSRLFSENKSRVECCQFPSDIVKGVGGGEAVYK